MDKVRIQAEATFMLVCVCRVIYEEDFDTPEELKNRIMEDDFICGQLRYLRDIEKPIINPKDNTSL